MSKGLIITLSILGVILISAIGIVGWGVSKYNSFVIERNNVDATWANVEAQYQRRYDLIPNLVETVKGFATQEKEVLIGVTEARSRVGQFNITPEVLNDPKALQTFNKLQGELSSALSRLMVVMEKYPELKSNENFLALQGQLEGTENRINKARTDFNESVKGYNNKIELFPGNLIAGMFGFTKRTFFEADAGAATAPKVQF